MRLNARLVFFRRVPRRARAIARLSVKGLSGDTDAPPTGFLARETLAQELLWWIRMSMIGIQSSQDRQKVPIWQRFKFGI